MAAAAPRTSPPTSEGHASSSVYTHILYGRVVTSPRPLPAPLAPSSSTADISIHTTEASLPPVATHNGRDGWLYEMIDDGSVALRYHDDFELNVSADGSVVRARRAEHTTEESLYAYLLGHGLSVALLQRGVEGVHAAAFETNGRAIAVLGDCGFGKSTLSAHAIRAGARLLTDDLLILDGSSVLPGPARIKLNPEIAHAVFGTRAGTPMNDGRGKWIYDLGDTEFSADSARLDRIYMLVPDAEEIGVNQLSESDAFHALLTATYDPLQQSAARLASHMRYHAALARSIPVFQLHVPRRLSELENVIAAI